MLRVAHYSLPFNRVLVAAKVTLSFLSGTLEELVAGLLEADGASKNL